MSVESKDPTMNKHTQTTEPLRYNNIGLGRLTGPQSERMVGWGGAGRGGCWVGRGGSGCGWERGGMGPEAPGCPKRVSGRHRGAIGSLESSFFTRAARVVGLGRIGSHFCTDPHCRFAPRPKNTFGIDGVCTPKWINSPHRTLRSQQESMGPTLTPSSP